MAGLVDLMRLCSMDADSESKQFKSSAGTSPATVIFDAVLGEIQLFTSFHNMEKSDPEFTT